MRRIVIIGATGSVGSSTFRVVDQHPGELSVVGLAARSDGAGLMGRARQYGVKTICLYDAAAAKQWKNQAEALGLRLLSGPPGLEELVCLSEVDTVVAASPGVEALPALLSALEHKKTLAVANKESLVLGGAFLSEAAQKNGVSIIPLDSEHNALFQCMQGVDRESVKKIIITASGGPFLKTDLDALAHVTPESALRHPTWTMGPKVSLDSATMANKGLELMEAKWLFGLRPDQIDAWLHPQSLVHGLVELVDGSLLAHMAFNDMVLPIQYGLLYPQRLASACSALNLDALRELNFMPLQPERYPCFFLAKEALNAGGAAPAIFNAANTVAGAAFLAGKISFLQIPSIIDKALQGTNTGPLSCLEEALQLDQSVRSFCKSLIFKD